MAMSNSDTRAFADHLHKLMFIKRLQEREGLMHKHFDGAGLLPGGGGLGRGGGLPIGRGLDDGGFSKRKPIIKQEMLTGVINFSDEDMNNALADHEAVKDDGNFDEKIIVKNDDKGNVVTDDKGDPITETKYEVNKNVRILGKKGTLFTEKERDSLKNETGYRLDDMKDTRGKNKTVPDPINFTGQTSSKGIVFTKDSGEVLKFRSIAALSKASGLSKYKILGKFKPKKTGDTLKHPTLLGGGTIEFVNKAQLIASTST